MAVLTTIMNKSSIDDVQESSSDINHELVVVESEKEKKKKKKQDHVDVDVEAALAVNKKLVQKYQAQFPKIPTMTSTELVERWKQHDREDDARDDSIASSTSSNSDSTGSTASTASCYSYESFQKTARLGPLLLLDVRSKAERAVSMIPGAVSMDDLEKIRWMNKHVHNFYPEEKQDQADAPIPTIVLYCTIGYRSGREAQRLVDDLTSTFGIDIGTSVDIKQLDGILSYSFVEEAPPLMSHTQAGGSDYVMTRRIHCYRKEWSTAIHPECDVIYFNANTLKLYKHLFQTGVMSAVRKTQHQFLKSTTTTKKKSTKETIYASTRSLDCGELKGSVYVNNKPVYTNNIRNSRTSSRSQCTNTIHAPKIVVGGIGLGDNHTTSDLTSVVMQAHDTSTMTTTASSSSSPTHPATAHTTMVTGMGLDATLLTHPHTNSAVPFIVP